MKFVLNCRPIYTILTQLENPFYRDMQTFKFRHENSKFVNTNYRDIEKTTL